MTAPVNILPLGGCLLKGPLAAIKARGDRLTFSKYRPVGDCYTFGLMLQVISLLRGEREVAKEVLPLCGLPLATRPVAGADTFDGVDMALLEPASPIEITFRGASLNRLKLSRFVIEPMRALGPQGAKAAAQWFRVGIEGVNPDVRVETANTMVSLLPGDFADRALFEAVVLETTSFRGDVLEGFRLVREAIGRPCGVVGYVFQYLADGRAVSWPAGFLGEVRDAARRLDLPFMEPADFVNQHPAGVADALKPDLRHYSPEFNAFMGEVLVEFCEDVRDGARSRAAA